ncbi:MAG: type II toxin-antitoxin system HicB family antitoxin [Thermoleophilia bacterium]|nr:type II toxin-antitoxin system HicB family antitoxin [Thermoleophilia bacterium]
MSNEHTYSVVVEQDEDGWFVATCPSLNHVASQGETVQEALEHLKEAMEVYIETLRDHGDPIPAPRQMSTSAIDVTDAFGQAV